MHRYNLFLDPVVITQLKRVAKAQDITVSDLIRTAINAYLKALDGRNRPSSPAAAD